MTDTFHIMLSNSLKDIFEDGRMLDQTIAYWLKTGNGWHQNQKSFYVETLHGMVQWWRLLKSVSDDCFGSKSFNYETAIDVYRVLFGNEAFAEGITKNFKVKTQEAFKRLSHKRAIRLSIPDWLDQLAYEELGDKMEKEFETLTAPASQILRTNRIHCTRDILLSELEREGYRVEALGDSDAIHLVSKANIFASRLFKQGWFEQQDYSSQQVSEFLEVVPGMRVIDACAGNGGKTLHLASLMGNKGRIVALDTAAWKLEELRRRGRRAGVSIVETREIESSKVVKRLAGTADRLLIDAPCSGTGVFRRNPDAKWRLTLNAVNELRKIQADILSGYSKMVKVGGKLVYSTCSILPSENEKQVQQFLDLHSNFKLDKEQTLCPTTGYDGFYMARLVRVS